MALPPGHPGPPRERPGHPPPHELPGGREPRGERLPAGVHRGAAEVDQRGLRADGRRSDVERAARDRRTRRRHQAADRGRSLRIPGRLRGGVRAPDRRAERRSGPPGPDRTRGPGAGPAALPHGPPARGRASPPRVAVVTALSRPLIVASNRGPVSFERDESGELFARRGGGGLVTALTGALSMTGGLWIACAMTEGDREQAASSDGGRIEVLAEDVKYDLRYLVPPEDVFDRYYNVISNRVLWFLHHFLWDTVRSPRFGAATREAWADYTRVNRDFAESLAAAGEGRDVAPGYLVQDYHLSLVPAMLRERRPDALIGHFSHTPFSGPGYLGILPPDMADGLVRGLLGADVLGFQSKRWAELFLMSCRMLPDAKVDLRRGRVDLDGRRTLVRVYPISVDAQALRSQAGTPDAGNRRRRLRATIPRDGKLILRVDRTELSKNILRGFLAFETLLKEHEEWRSRAQMLTLLNPSRRGIPEYRAYTRECLAAADRINKELGTEAWKPIDVRIQDDYDEDLAAVGAL